MGGEVLNTEVMNRGRQNDGPHQGETYIMCVCMCVIIHQNMCVCACVCVGGGGAGAGDGTESFILWLHSVAIDQTINAHTHARTHTHTHTHILYITLNFHNFMLLCDLQMWSWSAKQDELVKLSKCYHHAQSDIYHVYRFSCKPKGSTTIFWSQFPRVLFADAEIQVPSTEHHDLWPTARSLAFPNWAFSVHSALCWKHTFVSARHCFLDKRLPLPSTHNHKSLQTNKIYCNLRMYFWWSLYTLYFLAGLMKVTVCDSGLCCCDSA